MTLTFDGLYMKVSTPVVTLYWDGIGSVIIALSPETATLGLCGNNRADEPLTPRYRSRRRYNKGRDILSAEINVTITTVPFKSHWICNLNKNHPNN